VPESRDSITNTFVVAIGVSLVCSVLVSAAAVLLQPLQEKNERLYRQQIVLEVAGLYEPGVDVGDRFAAIDTALVDLAKGTYVDSIEAEGFDVAAEAKDPSLSIAIPAELDEAGIKRRAIYAPVYLVRDDNAISQIILPVYGKGLWSTMYGYLALEPDGNTVRGLQFYEHGETPGLGDQVEKPGWLAHWPGKKLFDADGKVRIEIVRGTVTDSVNADYQVDGMSGATLTGRGVTHLLRYWTGPNGFGPYLQKLSSEAASNE